MEVSIEGGVEIQQEMLCRDKGRVGCEWIWPYLEAKEGRKEGSAMNTDDEER